MMDAIREICLNNELQLLCGWVRWDWKTVKTYLSLIEVREETYVIIAEGSGETFEEAAENLLWDWQQTIKGGI